MADLKTNYKDDVLDTSKNEKRKFRMIQNDDGTVSFEDATEYTQEGDPFGGADINATNGKVNEINESLSKKQDASTAITTSNISEQNVNAVGGSTIDDIHTDAQKRVNTRQEKLIMELYTASTNTNYAIVNKEGYTLLSAHTVRDDSSYFVKGINKRNDGRYTLIIDGLTSSATMSFWLTWAKE
ncbi:hypothetical protein [Roseburia sp. 831b]|uniref:hypothetical protein n=1 Tax=Roseburia sp. 831b TaxID=1261635 RepID=UPI0009533383|nr:hypothetical protein [Roseburia sp. 831b]WVK74281.1 hypothetical protein BIV16_07120 [Roseburia sp. 831b]